MSLLAWLGLAPEPKEKAVARAERLKRLSDTQLIMLAIYDLRESSRGKLFLLDRITDDELKRRFNEPRPKAGGGS